MTAQATAAAATASPRAIAEAAGARALLNAYLRESGGHGLTLQPDAPPAADDRLRALGAPFLLRLPMTGTAVLGAFVHRSPGGRHEYGEPFFALLPGADAPQPLAGAVDLAALLVDELAAVHVEPLARARYARSLLDRVENSLGRTALYVERSRRPELRGEAGDLLAAERGLTFGHPFHPAPKSSIGFDADDLNAYAPELGGRFPLHWLAATPESIDEDFLPRGRERAIPAAVARAAAGRVPVPVHPWQAERLRAGRAVTDLGPLGPVAHATSSVRTVALPSERLFVKLALEVRITNFTRVNTPEELRRAVDASRVAAALHRDGLLEILGEIGRRGIVLDGDEPDPRLSVLFRPMPRPLHGREPMVLAALLTPAPDGGEPPLTGLVRRAGHGEIAWFTRYVDVALIPLLALFVRTGVSLEAHTQNALLGVHDGWPERLCARDMEGASLARDAGAIRGCLGRLLPEGSPALYTSDEAWRRLTYYVVTNQIGDVVTTLARHGDVDEDALWRVARGRIAGLRCTLRTAWGAPYLDDLLERPTLPAKANFLSSLAGRGEAPLYVEIPNPLRGGP